jgi:hypothetical protein
LSNILSSAARSDSLPLIEDVLEQLDIPAASGLETVRIYPLSHADPAVIQKDPERHLFQFSRGQHAGGG